MPLFLGAPGALADSITSWSNHSFKTNYGQLKAVNWNTAANQLAPVLNCGLDGLTHRATVERGAAVSISEVLMIDNKQKQALPVTIRQKMRYDAVILVDLAADCVAWKDSLSSSLRLGWAVCVSPRHRDISGRTVATGLDYCSIQCQEMSLNGPKSS